MNMAQMLMQGLTANNPMVAQIMQMKNSGMTPQAAMNMLKEAGVDPQQFMRQANQLFK